MDAPAESLRQTQLRRGIIPRTEMVSRLAKFDYINPEPIFPVIRISYLRYRYTELMTGIRVSLDTAIGSRLVIPGMGFAEVDIRLRGGVVEIKGPTLELPETLRRIKLLDTEWSRFSKYNQCVDVHLTEPGEISRLWPTGCMVDP